MPNSSPRIKIGSPLTYFSLCALLFSALTYLSGCAALIIDPLVAPLEQSLEQQENVDLLHDGTPSLLLMIDGLLANDPHNQKLLISGTKAYSSYSLLLAQYQKPEQAIRCAEHGKKLAQTLLTSIPALNKFSKIPLDCLKNNLDQIKTDDVAPLFWGGYGLAVWIKLKQGSPASLVALPRIELIMARVVELDESFNHGGAHIFLGAMYGSKPSLYGGNPKASRRHFEKALALAHRRFLPAQVAFAETYARQVFDRQLFKNLLEEVLTTPLAEAPRLKASNSLAKLKARQLLDRIDEFF